MLLPIETDIHADTGYAGAPVKISGPMPVSDLLYITNYHEQRIKALEENYLQLEEKLNLLEKQKKSASKSIRNIVLSLILYSVIMWFGISHFIDEVVQEEITLSVNPPVLQSLPQKKITSKRPLEDLISEIH